MITDQIGSDGGNLQEREILYKLLFDMKGDLNDLKDILYFELIRKNKLRVPESQEISGLLNSYSETSAGAELLITNLNLLLLPCP